MKVNSNQVQALNNFQIKERIIQQSRDNSFSQILNQTKENKEVKFSKHAMERAAQRGIAIEGNLISGIEDAVEKARAKGVKDIVIIAKEGAFVVNVKNSTVVTSMNTMEMKNNIFTNIDGAVII